MKRRTEIFSLLISIRSRLRLWEADEDVAYAREAPRWRQHPQRQGSSLETLWGKSVFEPLVAAGNEAHEMNLDSKCTKQHFSYRVGNTEPNLKDKAGTLIAAHAAQFIDIQSKSISHFSMSICGFVFQSLHEESRHSFVPISPATQIFVHRFAQYRLFLASISPYIMHFCKQFAHTTMHFCGHFHLIHTFSRLCFFFFNCQISTEDFGLENANLVGSHKSLNWRHFSPSPG